MTHETNQAALHSPLIKSMINRTKEKHVADRDRDNSADSADARPETQSGGFTPPRTQNREPATPGSSTSNVSSVSMRDIFGSQSPSFARARGLSGRGKRRGSTEFDTFTGMLRGSFGRGKQPERLIRTEPDPEASGATQSGGFEPQLGTGEVSDGDVEWRLSRDTEEGNDWDELDDGVGHHDPFSLSDSSSIAGTPLSAPAGSPNERVSGFFSIRGAATSLKSSFPTFRRKNAWYKSGQELLTDGQEALAKKHFKKVRIYNII